jgi:hypothetical protein
MGRSGHWVLLDQPFECVSENSNACCLEVQAIGVVDREVNFEGSVLLHKKRENEVRTGPGDPFAPAGPTSKIVSFVVEGERINTYRPLWSLRSRTPVCPWISKYQYQRP